MGLTENGFHSSGIKYSFVRCILRCVYVGWEGGGRETASLREEREREREREGERDSEREGHSDRERHRNRERY